MRRLALIAALCSLAAGCRDFNSIYNKCFTDGVCLEDGTKRLGPPDAKVSTVEVDRTTGVTADLTDVAQVTVTVRDADGNPLPNIAVTLAASGSNNALIQPAVTDAAGKAVGELRSSQAETKILLATVDHPDGALALEDQPTVRFDAGAAHHLAYLLAPGAASAGTAIIPAVQVEIVDANGNRVTSATQAITLSIGSGPVGATLSGGPVVSAVSGVAIFSDVKLNKPGTYTLAANAIGLVGVTSSSFPVGFGAPASLVFLSAPTSTVAGLTMADVVVSLRDSEGNEMTSSTAAVTLTLVGGPATATLSGTTVQTASAGRATFSGLSITQASNNYVLAASSPGGFAAALSATFSISPAAISPTLSQVTATPASRLADGLEAAELAVALRDAYDNPVPGASVSFLASGANNVYGQPGALTNSTGEAYGTLKSTGIGAKLISAQGAKGAPPVALSTHPTVTFTVPPPQVRVDRPPQQSSCFSLSYSVFQTQGLPVDVVVEYDDGSGTFKRATQAGSLDHDGVISISSSSFPGGQPHTFLWNSSEDLPRRLLDAVSVRVTASAQGVPSAPTVMNQLMVNNGLSLEVSEKVQLTGTYAGAVLAGDFNSDGKPDLAVFQGGGAGRIMTVRRGNGDGTFTDQSPVTWATGGEGNADAMLGDFNHDGYPDIAFFSPSSANLYVMAGSAAGFAVPAPVSIASVAQNAFSGDFDRDGHLDLLAAFAGSVAFRRGAGNGTFPTTSNSTIRSGYSEMAVGDFNRDGVIDLLTTYWNGGTSTLEVEMRPGVGDGTFTNVPIVSTLSRWLRIHAAFDMNNDGKLDLVGMDNGMPLISLGNGDGTFQPQWAYPTALSYAARARIADLDNDGAPDLVVMRGDGNSMSVLPGNGDGTLGTSQPYALGFSPGNVAFADFDRDGRVDLGIGHSYVSECTIVRNTTPLRCERSISAPANTFVGASSSPEPIVVSDFNRDGKPDVAVGDVTNGYLQVMHGLGNGTFVTPLVYAVGSKPYGLRLADVDKDGILDLITINDAGGGTPPPSTISIYKGLSNGAFYYYDELTLPGRGKALAAGDLNGDGRPDFVSALGFGPSTYGTTLSLPGIGYQPATSNPLSSSQPQGVLLADVTGDGALDLISNSFVPAEGLVWAPGLGGGAFSVPTAFGNEAVSHIAARTPPSGPAELLVGFQSLSAAVVGYSGGALVEIARRALFTSGSITNVAYGDVNGDGTQDVLAVNAGSKEISTSLRSGQTLGPSIIGLVGGTPARFVPEDFNADGRLDVAVTLTNSRVATMLGRGDGTFGIQNLQPLPADARGVATGDFDRDGKLDLAVATAASVVIARTTLGAFSAGAPTAVGTDNRAIVSGDFNRDGKLDVVVVDSTGPLLRFLPGAGNGTFGSAVTSPGVASATTAAAADVDTDGKLDLVVMTGGTSALFRGIGDGTFAAPTAPVPYGTSQAVQLADFDADGKIDIVALSASNFLRCSRGDGAGNFSPPVTLSVTGAFGIASGDLNRDGLRDVVIRSTFSSTQVVVYLGGPGGTFSESYRDTTAAPGIPLVADLNSDGRNDVLMLGTGVVRTYAGKGDGTLDTPKEYGVSGVQFGAADDFDHDGKVDVALTVQSPSAAVLLRGK